MYVEISLSALEEKPTFGKILMAFYHGLCTDNEALRDLKKITSDPDDIRFWQEQMQLVKPKEEYKS